MSMKLKYAAGGDYYIPTSEQLKEERSIGRWDDCTGSI